MEQGFVEKKQASTNYSFFHDLRHHSTPSAGDLIVGLASYGQAAYEDGYNGGMGSNGLTSARHDVFNRSLATKYPESFDPQLPSSLVYTGSKNLTDSVDGAPLDAGKLVLSATRTYAPVIKRILDKHRSDIHGMVHCSGGAQTKILHFLREGLQVVKDALFPIPPLFTMIQAESGTEWKEMYQVRRGKGPGGREGGREGERGGGREGGVDVSGPVPLS